MKVILRESFENLGRPGDVVEVKGGFARNYLVPRGIAYPFTGIYKHMFELERDELLRRDEEARAKAEKLAGKAADLELEFIVRMGDRGKMFGAITNADIAERLAEKGVEVDRRKIQLPEPIKTTGEHVVAVKPHGDVAFNVRVLVTAEVPPEEVEGVEAAEAAEAVEGAAETPEPDGQPAEAAGEPPAGDAPEEEEAAPVAGGEAVDEPAGGEAVDKPAGPADDTVAEGQQKEE